MFYVHVYDHRKGCQSYVKCTHYDPKNSVEFIVSFEGDTFYANKVFYSVIKVIAALPIGIKEGILPSQMEL